MRYLVLILCACYTPEQVLAAPAPIGSRETGITVSPQSGRITVLRLGSVELPVSEGDFQLIASGRTYRAQDFRVTGVNSQPTSAVVKLSNSAFDITIEYVETDSGAVRKTLRILPRSEISLERVDVQLLRIPGAAIEIARAESEQRGVEGFPICAFLEARGYGAFFSLDFAYSEIQRTGSLLSI